MVSIDGYYSILVGLGWFTLIIIDSNSWVAVIIRLGNKHDLIGLIWWGSFFRGRWHTNLVTTWRGDTSGDRIGPLAVNTIDLAVLSLGQVVFESSTVGE